MSQSTVSPLTENVVDGKEQLLRLLNEALGLADTLSLPPEIGARIQEVIDLACGCRDPADPY
jgi:hypothetical protein